MNYKKTFILILSIILLIMITSCSSKEDKIIGSWYNLNLKELILSDDGVFSHGDEGGTYTYDGDQIILLYNYGETEIFEVSYEDDTMVLINTSTSIESYKYYYTYDIAYDKYSQKQQEREEQRVSTVDALREYFVGTWVGDGSNSLNNYVITINDDNTFVINSDDCYYEGTSHAGLEGTWEFEQDWNDQRYIFKTTYKSVEFDETYSSEKVFYIPDWEDRDLDDISITIYDVTLTKKK